MKVQTSKSWFTDRPLVDNVIHQSPAEKVADSVSIGAAVALVAWAGTSIGKHLGGGVGATLALAVGAGVAGGLAGGAIAPFLQEGAYRVLGAGHPDGDSSGGVTFSGMLLGAVAGAGGVLAGSLGVSPLVGGAGALAGTGALFGALALAEKFSSRD